MEKTSCKQGPCGWRCRALTILPSLQCIGPVARAAAVLVLVVACTLASPARAGEAAATGFVMQNRAPFAALIGVPGRWPGTADKFAELAWNVSSHAMAENSDDFAVFADGETSTLTGRLQFAPSQRLRVGVQLPWIKHSGGFLDSTIDAWHKLFNLNEGIRPEVDKNQLNYVLQRQGVDLFRLNESVSGFGDLQLAMTGDIGSFERYAQPETVSGYFLRIPWRFTLNVKLPTGDIDKLTGSGNADIAAGLGWRSPDAPGTRIRWWLDVGLVLPGNVDIDGLNSASRVYYYDTALTWRIVRSFDAIVQVAGNSGLYAGDAASLGEAVAQLAIGGLWHFSPKFGLRFGIFEDLLAKSAPDFGIEISLLIRSW